MSRDRVLAIALRLLRQIFRDRRTLALILVVPTVIMALINVAMPGSLTGGAVSPLDFLAPALIGGLGFFFAFLLTGVSLLRERTLGTLERLMASPVSGLEIVAGYLLGFFLFAVAQTLIVLLFAVYVLDVRSLAGLWEIVLLEVVVVVGAVNLGILASAYARNEFQVVQFIPLVILPQFLLGGIFWPVEQMAGYLQGIAKALPMTYAIRGTRALMLDGSGIGGVGFELGVLAAFAAGFSLLSTAMLRRRAGR